MFDYHALLPEFILGATLVAVIVVDLLVSEERKHLVGVVGLVGLVGAAIPLLTLATCEDLFSCGSGTRSMFDGSYVVDDFALVLKGLFILAGYGAYVSVKLLQF